MDLKKRIILTTVVGVASAILCYIRLAQREQIAADFTFSWRAAWFLLDGQNPYTAIQPTGDYPFQTFFYYPLPAALVAIPFSFLSPYLAGALFFGLGSGLLAFAVTREGWKHMAIFLSAPYWVALAVAQWSPLVVAAMLLPWMQWLLVCKPNLGAAGFLYRPTRIGLIGAALLLGLSLILLPSWPMDWLSLLRSLEGHPPPILILPFGPLIAIALLRWRLPESRLLLGLSMLPQLLLFYDQLPLWLLAPDLKLGLLYSVLSWVAYLIWRLTGIDPASGQILSQPTQLILAFLYLPALVLLFWSYRKQLDSHPATRDNPPMELKLTRWTEKTPPTEAQLREIFSLEELSPYSWSNGPGDVYAAHSHAFHKVLYVVSGSITWILPGSDQEIETFPGDRLDLPRGTQHAARVGTQGVTCLEAHCD